MNLGEPRKSGVVIPATQPIEEPEPPLPKREVVPITPAKAPEKVDAGGCVGVYRADT